MVHQSFLMIQECEKMNKNTLSFLLVFLVIFSLNNTSVSATADQNISDEDILSSITGYSKFIIEDEIEVNSEFNASWESSIILSDQIGTDLLLNSELGLRAQIDIHLGNSDGFIDSNESDLFDQLFRTERNWTNSENGGCCIFDYNPLYSPQGVNLLTSKVVAGPIELENSTWGWNESTDLIGHTDSRVTRIIDFPRVGSLVEEVPLMIFLPADWEYTYSAMGEIFSGEPGEFIVNRSEANVASNIRVTISNNQMPNALGYRTSTGTMITLTSNTLYYGECDDSTLDNNQQWWTLSNNDTLVLTHYGSNLSFISQDYGFQEGDVASIAMYCKDWFNVTDTWYEEIVIDSIFPTWESVISYINENNEIITFDINQSIAVKSDTSISFNISANDPNSESPVDIKIISNKTPNYIHRDVNNLDFSDAFYQNDNVNGLHLNLSERHKAKPPTSWSVNLTISDDAGNTIYEEWEIIVLDGIGPTIVPDLIINNQSISSNNLAREGDLITISLQQSFDDLDSINDTRWSLSIDNGIILDNVTMNQIDKMTLGPFTSGTHVFSIDAYDSSLNHQNLAFGLAISPSLGVDIELISTEIDGKLIEGNTVLFSASLKNNRASSGSGQFCVDSQCGPFVGVPAANSNSPGYFDVELSFELSSSTPISTYFKWQSESAGENGQINIESNIPVEPSWQKPIQTVLLVFVFLSLFVIIVNKLWGVDSQRP
ncbi:MAG: hypothetical protein CMA98_05350 [Euryarchaeota archaeon]|nr:hypothetical protein [Euryarchaeota archaeon]|tara:strand:- start:36940 stop:39087 length:2148 start_codon:yes stop_codon:yes gene_type:complete